MRRVMWILLGIAALIWTSIAWLLHSLAGSGEAGRVRVVDQHHRASQPLGEQVVAQATIEADLRDVDPRPRAGGGRLDLHPAGDRDPALRQTFSRFLDGGCLSPEEGTRTVPISESEIRYGTISADLERLTGDRDQSRAIWLFHGPPHRTALDHLARPRLAEGLVQDPHVGSIAIRDFILARQPLVTLHGHVHESTRLTGEWRQQLGRTWMFQGAHDGDELALVRFPADDPARATRNLV